MRWTLVVIVVIGVLALVAVAASPALHSTGGMDCTTLDESASGPEHGTHESDMYVEENGTETNCPVNDGAEMGVTGELRR
jgi:hypothetical protein